MSAVVGRCPTRGLHIGGVGPIPRLPGRDSGKVRAEVTVGWHRGEGFTEHTVDMDRPGRGARGTVHGLVDGRQHRLRGYLLGGARKRGVPAGIVAEQSHLVDGLVRAGVEQLRGTVGAEHDEGHAGVGRLDHGGKVVGDGAARGADEGRGTSGGSGVPECVVRGAALVEVHNVLGGCVFRDRHRERCATRAGRKTE